MDLSPIESLKGWCPPEKAAAMAALVVAERPRVCVEIGVFGGRSLAATAIALREAGGGVVYGIDPWDTAAAVEGLTDPTDRDWWGREDLADAYRSCCEGITRLGLWPWVRLLCGRSLTMAGAFAPGSIDVLHIDGNHSVRAAVSDVLAYADLLRPGGWVWVDDSDWSSVRPALALLEETCRLVTDAGRWRLYRHAG